MRITIDTTKKSAKKDSGQFFLRNGHFKKKMSAVRPKKVSVFWTYEQLFTIRS